MPSHPSSPPSPAGPSDHVALTRSDSGEDEPGSRLRALFADIVADGYDDAVARRAAAGAGVGQVTGRRRAGRAVSLLALVAIGALLAVAGVQAVHTRPAATRVDQQLVGEIDRQTAVTDGQRTQAADLEQQVAGLRRSTLDSTRAGQQVADVIDRLAGPAGLAAVTGPGLRITVDDAPADSLPAPGGTPDASRVLDVDLQQLTNGLWQAGAEAVSINGQRLTALTAIRGAGEAITVDYRPIARPYVVLAIGDPRTLAARFAASAGGQWMANLRASQHVVFTVASADQLVLPADSHAQLRIARPEVAR